MTTDKKCQFCDKLVNEDTILAHISAEHKEMLYMMGAAFEFLAARKKERWYRRLLGS